jgi:transposase
MVKSLSVDLRRRVVDAINGGLSRRQAAERFKISPSSAIRWHQRHRTTGALIPRKQGGDRRSRHIEVHADIILALVEERSDMTLSEIREQLVDQGVHAGIATLWRFFDRRGITWKKRPLTRRSKAVPMS